MSKSLADNPFITEAKDKNGDKWYHQIILEKKDKEIERLNNIIKEVRNELNDFNESYLIDEGDYGVYNLLKEIIDKLDKGSE